MRPSRHRVVPAVALVALAFGAFAPRGQAGVAGLIEDEFEAVIRTVTPATVYCVAPPAKGPSPGGSSGVLVTRDGYVLSDGDVGYFLRPRLAPDGKPVLENGRPAVDVERSDEVDVRVPDVKRGTYAVYPAKVVRRVRSIDSTLLKITKPPASGFPFVVPRSSADLDVGQFTFALGTSNPRDGGDALASLSAGIVAALVPLADGDAAGRYAEIYTSAAVNDGVNGGPLVDVDGGLVGMISSSAPATAADPFQFLGKAMPMDRVRSAYRDLPMFAAVFPDLKAPGTRSKQAALLETAFGATARKVYASVVSLELTRKAPVTTVTPAGKLDRYQGPTSGIVVSRDGWIVASLYAFADTAVLSFPAPIPGRGPVQVAADLEQIEALTAHFADGTSAPAKIVAHDQRLGLVCVKATLPGGYDAVPLEPAAAQDLRAGRLVLSVANPYGKERRPRPLLTLGILSRVHPDDALEAWAGDLQTDANTTDGTVGGALVDAHGRLLGLSTLWNPAQQGRNSGIGYGVPWAKIEAQLPELRAGRSRLAGGAVMKVELRQDGQPVLAAVLPGGPAEKAGLKAGDRILSIDERPIPNSLAIRLALRDKRGGDRIRVAVERDGTTVTVEIVLENRDEAPAPTAPTPPPAMAEEPPPMGETPPGMADAPPAMDTPPPAMTDEPPPMGETPPGMADVPPPMDDPPGMG